LAVVIVRPSESPQMLWDREPEVAQLERALAWAQHGEGGVLVLRGPAGIGKSSLLLDAQRRAAAREMLVLAARAAPFERGFPYGVVRQLFEPIVARGDVPSSELFSGAAAHAREVLEDEPLDIPEADPSFASLHALYWLTSNLSARAPVLVSVDDASWCDPASLRFLEFLVRRLSGMRVTLVLAYRTGDPQSPSGLVAFERDPLAQVVEPAPLARSAIAGMLSEALSEEVDPGFCTACEEATGGNPFLIAELLRALQSEGVSPREREVGRVREIGAIAVAPAVTRRLAALGERAWLVAKALAVLGENVRREDLAGTAMITLAELEDEIAALTHARIVGADERLSFLHPLVAEAVRASLSGTERTGLHQAAVQTISRRGGSPRELAPHLISGAVGAHPEAAAILRDAARWALGAGAPEAAVAYLGRAVQELDEDDLPPLLLDLGEAKMQAGDPTATDDLRRAIMLAPDARTRALARVALSAALVTATGDYAGAAEVLDAGIDEIATEDPELARRMEAYLLASILMAGPGVASFPASIGDRLTSARAVCPPRTVADRLLLGSLALEELLGGAPAGEVIALADQALASDEVVSVEGPSSLPFYLAIVALSFCDQAERVAAVTTLTLAKARASASLTGFVWASAWRASANLRMGRLIDAEADARAALDTGDAYGSDPSIISARVWLAGSLIAQGRFDEASSTLATTPEPDPPNSLTYLLLATRASLHLARSDFVSAASELERYYTLSESNLRLTSWRRPVVGPFPSRSLWARALIALGDLDAARALIAEELPLARAFGTHRAVGMTLHAGAFLEHGDAQLALLRDATEQLGQSQSRLEYAAALCDYGAALRRANRRADARAPLKAALQIARDAHARPLQDRAAQELKATGARVSRPQESGIDALTASERRIAAMAASGMSNRDIAQALFVTVKTIETHLGHVYQKLNLTGRTQLAAALGEHGGSAEGTLDAQLARTTSPG
jgi:DNA-binding CsgD family transcriptional regulator